MSSLEAATHSDPTAAPASADVVVACPDARPPAYQAVVGLARAGRLQRFVTAYYHRGDGPWLRLGRRAVPGAAAKVDRYLGRRHEPQIPADRVEGHATVDIALAVENRAGARRQAVARWRTRHFDAALERRVARWRPGRLLLFSDVGSGRTLPRCRALGVPTVLSMVHGDVREEQLVLEQERERSPGFLSMYLAEGRADASALGWLYERRLRDLELADRILVPSEHIARWITRHGTPAEKVQVLPYAADVERFRPDPTKRSDPERCTFLFAGGITQRKGIRYLLEAWRRVRRPGWRLQLLGGLPADPTPLEPYRDEVEWLGRRGHAEVPEAMAAADVFVFPSLFEGSAVVTYEALACGLPSIVTESSGSVVRDGLEGLVVLPADIDALARAMERLGTEGGLRSAMSAAARARAEAYDWPRYHAGILSAVSR